MINNKNIHDMMWKTQNWQQTKKCTRNGAKYATKINAWDFDHLWEEDRSSHIRSSVSGHYDQVSNRWCRGLTTEFGISSVYHSLHGIYPTLVLSYPIEILSYCGFFIKPMVDVILMYDKY